MEDAVTPAQLTGMQNDMANWVEESRAHNENYGKTINGKPRFDLDPAHSVDHPGLRRVNAPIEVSEAHFKAATDSKSLIEKELSDISGLCFCLFE